MASRSSATKAGLASTSTAAAMKSARQGQPRAFSHAAQNTTRTPRAADSHSSQTGMSGAKAILRLSSTIVPY